MIFNTQLMSNLELAKWELPINLPKMSFGLLSKLKKILPPWGCVNFLSVLVRNLLGKVSKSSISAILKTHHLNSSVGRRSSKATSKKKDTFKLPLKIKQQLFMNIPKDTGVLEKGAPEPEQKLEPKSEPNLSPDPEIVPLMPDPVERPPDQEEEVISSKNVSKKKETRLLAKHKVSVGQNYQGLGAVFLLEAQRELVGGSLMADIFKRFFIGDSIENIQGVFDAACLYRLLNEPKGLFSDENDHALWALCEGVRKEDFLRFYQSFQNLELQKQSVFEYIQKKQQLNQFIQYFEIVLQNGTRLMLDSHLSCVLNEQNQSQAPLLPINKGLAELSSTVISNIEPISLCLDRTQNQIDQNLYQLIAALENNEGCEPTEIRACDAAGQELVSFSSIPRQKRYFTLAIFPEHKEFSTFTKALKWRVRQPFYRYDVQDYIYYTESQTDYFSTNVSKTIGNYKVIPIWKDKSEQPECCLITNHIFERAPEVVEIFLKRHPGKKEKIFNCSFFEHNIQAQNVATCGGDDQDLFLACETPLDILDNYIQMLHDYSMAHFWGFEGVKK